MSSSSILPRKRGLGRGPNKVPKAPTNLDDRTVLQVPPNGRAGLHPLSRGLPYLLHIKRQFGRNFRYRWAEADAHKIEELFWLKCLVRTKDNLKKEREKALHNAGIDHPGESKKYMHEYSPWWCSRDVWVVMCQQWRAEEWMKKGKINANNRAISAAKREGKRHVQRRQYFSVSAFCQEGT